MKPESKHHSIEFKSKKSNNDHQIIESLTVRKLWRNKKISVRESDHPHNNFQQLDKNNNT